jgi:pilus assembly protein FimV
MINNKIRCASVLMVLVLLVPRSDVYALALSNVRLNSYLNQPLNATVVLLSATPAELDSLNAYISRSKSISSGMKSWPDVKVELVRMIKGSSYLEITSRDNMREPVFNFMLDVGCSSGRIQREYSLLLSPPK